MKGFGSKGCLLESDKVTRGGQLDGLEGALSPRHNLVLDALIVLDSTVGERLGLAFGEDNFLGIVEDDASETNLLETLDSVLDLGVVLSGAELGVKGLLDEEAQERVTVRVEEDAVGVCQDSHDAQRGRQQKRRGRDGHGGERSEDHDERQDGEGRTGRVVGHGIGHGDGVCTTLRGLDTTTLRSLDMTTRSKAWSEGEGGD